MRLLWQSLGRLAYWKKLVIVLLLIIVVLTWLGVCLVLGSYLAP